MHRILVVDVEPEILKILNEFFTKMGFGVVTTSEGARATEILQSDPNIDLMILDLKMPGTGGIEVLENIKKMNVKIPIVILTGSINIDEYVDDLSRLGYNKKGILVKPVDLKVLLGAVEKKLAKKEQ